MQQLNVNQNLAPVEEEINLSLLSRNELNALR